MNKTIHSFWISGKLQPINLLTICSFLKHGHDFKLYAYDLDSVNTSLSEANKILQDVSIDLYNGKDANFYLYDAREILPESEIFYYKNMLGGNPNFKFGGIAERLKAEMLFQLGGWHVDLDVTCLKNFSELDKEIPFYKPRLLGPEMTQIKGRDYVLRPHEKGVVGNIIKAPKHSELARRYVEHTKTIDENNRIWEKSFMGLNKIVADLGLEKYILPKEVLGDDSSEYWEKFLKAGNTPNKHLHAIHWCNAMQKDSEENSFYQYLLKQYNLL